MTVFSVSVTVVLVVVDAVFTVAVVLAVAKVAVLVDVVAVASVAVIVKPAPKEVALAPTFFFAGILNNTFCQAHTNTKPEHNKQTLFCLFSPFFVVNQFLPAHDSQNK